MLTKTELEKMLIDRKHQIEVMLLDPTIADNVSLFLVKLMRDDNAILISTETQIVKPQQVETHNEVETTQHLSKFTQHMQDAIKVIQSHGNNGVTAQNIANALSLKYNTISNVLNSIISKPNSVIERIANIHGVYEYKMKDQHKEPVVIMSIHEVTKTESNGLRRDH